MELKNPWLANRGQLLQWVNLRPEESERTFLMFAFYTTTSIGLVWLEASTIALFLDRYTAEDGLPWIYIASAGIGAGLGFLYSQLQKLLPLRRVTVSIALLMAAPLLLFWMGVEAETVVPIKVWELSLAGITVFLMRLWLEAIYVLNDLNTSITANQLFNIREIKRTYPLISSGILVADVISGFSLTVLIGTVGLKNVVLLACIMMTIGAGILFYLSRAYRQFFPDFRRRLNEDRSPDFINRRVQGPLKRYVLLLFAFFILAQVVFLLVDFQFLSQLQQQRSKDEIAAFLGVFNGVLGVFELAMQWLASSRVIERAGVFAAAVLLPGVIGILGVVSMTIAGLSWGSALFVSLVLLKFLDELFHYTLFASVGPVLFQPIPAAVRGRIQAVVRGIADPLSTGATGLALLSLVWLSRNTTFGTQSLSWLLPAIVVLALIWVLVISLLRAKYVGLLVISAERGQLKGDVDLLELKRAVVEALDQSGTEAHKASCIELLSRLDPKNAGEVLAPLLEKLTPSLQRLSLDKMLLHPNPAYLAQVQALINHSPTADVLAVALRYVWLTEEDPDIRQLKPYLRPEVDAEVRGTAASLMLRRGNPTQKAEATNTLRRMLTHKSEWERIMGCRALGEAVYLQALRLYIPNLLQDESLRVRRALLEAIAATHLEEFYPSLLKGLHYKSTRDDAMKALVRLENEALPMLLELADDVYKPEVVRLHAWKTIGQIGTDEALDALISRLMTAWGTTRRNILKILLEMPEEIGIESVLERMGRSGVERLIDQEIMFIGQTYAASLDLAARDLDCREAELLQRSLQDMQVDANERLFILMRLLYPIEAIKAAAFSLQSSSKSNIAQGLEILDNTIDVPSKRALLSILDAGSLREKLQSLGDLVSYEALDPSDRLRHLLDLRHFLSDWSLACCFHLARQMRWRLTAEQTLACLRHPKGFVREAVLEYLRMASPRALRQLLPMLKTDPDPIVADQVRQVLSEFEQPASNPSKRGNNVIEFPKQPGFKPL
ncbi:MFS transporter [Leptolyngbya sp. FACHB-36]|uniref:HEAT repeat domain-containing protein n=1 Tax=Leptolyngbya sp. FACHB-36 TaxID=2692808 RepID=UPI001680C655|nr:HEAT repeat domain-containing protein [Leptolyngbya sp. FACHB-36]MBD2019613.1 MFS transporter [Leptolyngbya sp. FACHB-36]